MSQWPSNILPSPNLSQRTEQSQSHSQKSLRSHGSVRGQANGMPIAESRSLEAAHILDQLQKEIVFLTGGRDRQGGPLLIFPPCRNEYFMPNDIAACLRYLIQIPSDESKRRGFTAIVDSRDGSWSNLVTLLGCLKQSLGDYLKQVLVLGSDGMGPRHSSSSSFRRDRGPNIEPQFINLHRLYTFVDRNQLIGSMGGTLMYRHSYWLQNRLDLEKFVRESRAAASHLDSAESEIQHRYRNKGPESPTSPVEALRQHQFFQDSTLSVPKQVIRDGRDLLHKLQQYNEAAMPGDGSVTTLDNLESQKQVKRTLQYIENRIDKIQNFLADQDRSLHMNVLRDDLQKEFRQVVEWILGPGEKLLASQTDIGDSFETAEVLRKRFEELEIKCADTYGHYAELRHRAEDLVRDHHASSDDIKAQRDYMDTVCRSFASRLERRRTLLITSVRFHRLTEEFTRKLDDLLGFLYDDREADTVETAQEALRQLQEKVDAIDTSANHGMRDGQSLLDEMTRPIKNAFGKDISPDYAHQIKHITQKLEELQERKMRCDDLAEVRKLRLQQTLQLRTCERDVDQAINWILELYDVMVTSHTNLGQTVQETESLHDEHRKFESAALGTYDYGKQLLQAAQVLRRSLRFELEPYNLRAQRLEEAWKKFSRGTSERANRLTVAAMFIGQSDKVYEGVEQLMVVVAQTLTGDISVLDALSRYGPEKQRVEMEHQDTDQMGRALLERLALPLVTTDGLERPLSQDEQGSTDMINGRLRKMGHKVAELNRYWSEMEQTGQPPSVQPKITRSMQLRPQGQSYYQGQRSTLPQRSQSQRSQDAGPYRGRDQPIRTQSLNKPESQGRGRVRKRPIPKQSSRRSTGEPGSGVPMDRPDTGQMNGYHSLPADRTNIPSQEYFEGPDSRPHVSQSYYPRSEEFLPNIPGSSYPSRGPAYEPGEERVPPVPPVRKSSFQQRGDQLQQNQGPAYQPYSNDESRMAGQSEWERDYQPYQTSETMSRMEPAMPLTQLESQILPSKSSSQSFSPHMESQIQPDVSNRSYSAIPQTVKKESLIDTVPRRSDGSSDRSRSPQHSKTETKVQKLDMGKFKMFEQKEPMNKLDSEREKSKSMSHLNKKPDDKGNKEKTRSSSNLHKKGDDKHERDSERARSTSHLHMKPDTLPKLQAYGQPDIMRSSLSTSTTQGAPIKRLHSKRVDEDPINFRELLTKFQSPQEEEVMETEEKKIVQAELNQVLASRAKVLEDLENEDLPRAVRRLKKDMDECGEWIRVRVHQMEPDLMEVGSTLEEALQLQQEHDQLLSKLQAKEEEIKQLLSRADSYTADNPSEATVYAAMSDTLAEAWRDLNDKLDYRRRLLAESVTFHQKANYFATQMEQAQTRFMNLPLATDVDSAKRQLRQHQEIKQDILEASKSTLDLGHSLLERIKEMGMHADFTNRHATTAACYGIEHLIELLQDRRRRLEDLWEQRRIRLEQSLQLFQLDQEVNKVLGWYRSTGTAQLKRTELGDSYQSAKRVHEEHHRFEQEARDIQDTVLRLVRTADQLLRRTHLDAEGVRQRLQAVDEESENFMNKLDTRRKNISMAMSFFGLAETAQTKLEEIEVRINTSDLPRNSAELADRHSQLSNVIVEVSTSALSEGHLLLERVSREDFGADGVRRRMQDLQQRCERLESLCKARRAEAWERSQTYLSFQEQYNSLQTWVTQIVLARLSQHSNMGTTLQEGHDFLEIHEHLEEDISDKSAEIKHLSEAVVSLVKSGDQEAKSAAEKVDHLTKQIQRLHRVTEVRIKLSLLYVSFHRLLQQNSNCMKSLEHILKSETENLQDLTDSAVQQTEELWSQVESSFRDLDDKGREFLKNSSTITDDETLQIRHAISTVEFLMTETRDHMTHMTTQWESWQTHVSTSRQFKTQWHQFIQDARKSIDRVLHLENEFFPVLAGDLGSSMDTANEYQRRLDNFMPEFEQAQAEIEEHLKTAEMLSLKGDTRGQKEQIMNELIKVHQRFQARIHEYQILLKMTIQFFKNLDQLDKLIEKTEQEYMESELPSDLNRAEGMLEEHKRKKQEITHFINYTAEEGDKIVVRVRQTDAEAVAKEDVQRVLGATEEYKRRWNSTWEEQERRLRQNLQICQFNFDLRQIHSEIDELHQHLQARRGSYGNSLPAAKMTSQAFKQFEMTVELIEKKINNFSSTAELMVQDKHYDSVHIRREIDMLNTKWTTFHTSVRDYRDMLDVSIIYFALVEESEQWMNDANNVLLNIGQQAQQCQTPDDANELLQKIHNYIDEGRPIQDERMRRLSELATQLYGDEGPSRVHNLYVQYQDLIQNFQQADNEVSRMKQNLEQMAPGFEEFTPMEVTVTAEAPPRPPRITQHLKNAEVMEGTKVVFEVHIESDIIVEVRWFKDNLPLNSPDYETRHEGNIASLTIEETFSEDTARYTIKVSNMYGEVESSAYLHVKGNKTRDPSYEPSAQTPIIQQDLKDVSTGEGKGIKLEVVFSASPAPEVTWFRGVERILPSNLYTITVEMNRSVLEIKEAYPEDSGSYSVIIRNQLGEARSTCQVTVESFYSSAA